MNDLLQAAYHLETDGDLLGAESTYRALTEQGFDDGALELSGFFRRHGQLEKAEQALLEGERRGDPRCAVNLGYMLSDRGDLEGAEAAFRRADDAGLAVGAYALGGLLYARGDADGALAANRRADERGDGGGAYNVGFFCCSAGSSPKRRQHCDGPTIEGTRTPPCSSGAAFATVGSTPNPKRRFDAPTSVATPKGRLRSLRSITTEVSSMSRPQPSTVPPSEERMAPLSWPIACGKRPLAWPRFIAQ